MDTNHPGDGWTGNKHGDVYERAIADGVDAIIYETDPGRWCGSIDREGLVEFEHYIQAVPTAVIAAERIAALADEVREDVLALATAWGLIP